MYTLITKDYKTFLIGDTVITDVSLIRPALPNDLVTIDNGYIAVEKRAKHTGLVGVIEMASTVKYGYTSRGIPIYLFVPWNESYPPFYVGSSHRSKQNVIAIVDYESWEPGMNCPRGSCRVVLGPCGDLAAEEAALAAHASPNPWKKSILPPNLLERASGNPDHLSGSTFHVDPPGCRDIDDAMTFIANPDGTMKVYIHISDVATLLCVNEPLWRAEQIGQTLYKDGAVQVGLFPPTVEESLSLLPGHSRLTLTLAFLWDPATNSITDVRWLHLYIIVKESYTYETILKSHRAALLKGLCVALGGADTDDAHDWIAQTMLFYNKKAAKLLKAYGEGILRSHDAPQTAVLSRIESFATIPKFLAYSSSKYCAAAEPNTWHWGLGEELYCHASSPIRRYADCINQTCIMNALFDYELPVPTHSVERLNATEKATKTFERDLFFVRALLLNAGKAVEPVQGVVVEVSEKCMKVWTAAWNMIVRIRKPVGGWELEPSVGMELGMRPHADYTQRNWKRRITIAVVRR